MMFRRKNLALIALTGVIASASLAACSSGSRSSASGDDAPGAASTPASTSTPAAAATSSPGSGLLSDASAKAKIAMSNPSGLTITTPLTKKPPTGKLIVSIQNANDVAAVENAAAEQAAHALGWTLKVVTEGSGVEDPVTAFESALALHPAAIHYSGTPATLLKTQLAEAKAQGVAVIPDAITDPLTPPMVSNTISGSGMVTRQGVQLADYVAAQSDGKANVQMFTLPVYPILTDFDNGFTTELARVCPDCRVAQNPQQETDIGTNTPGAVVSVLQKDPDTNWVIFSLGVLETGVLPALKSAGLASKVSIGGITPSQSNLEEMKQGQDEVWSGFSTPIEGWMYIDALARYFVGDPQVSADVPNQLITPQNLNTIEAASNGYYVGYAGYAAAFEKLWGVS
jgi:ribose transport system substrate-binding protein